MYLTLSKQRGKKLIISPFALFSYHSFLAPSAKPWRWQILQFYSFWKPRWFILPSTRRSISWPPLVNALFHSSPHLIFLRLHNCRASLALWPTFTWLPCRTYLVDHKYKCCRCGNCEINSEEGLDSISNSEDFILVSLKSSHAFGNVVCFISAI